MLPFESHRHPVLAFTRGAFCTRPRMEVATPTPCPQGPQMTACRHHIWGAQSLQDSTASHSCSLVGFLRHHLWESHRVQKKEVVQCQQSRPSAASHHFPSTRPSIEVRIKKKNLPPDQVLPKLWTFLRLSLWRKCPLVLSHVASSYSALRLFEVSCPSRWWPSAAFCVSTPNSFCASTSSL